MMLRMSTMVNTPAAAQDKPYAAFAPAQHESNIFGTYM